MAAFKTGHGSNIDLKRINLMETFHVLILILNACQFYYHKFKDPTYEVDPVGFTVPEVDHVWRIILMVGLLPAITTPNTTTFVVPLPAEIFPARLQSTFHAISAASGKPEAIVGAFRFPYLAQNKDPANVMMGILLTWCQECVVRVRCGQFSWSFVSQSKGESLRAMLGENEEKEVEKPHIQIAILIKLNYSLRCYIVILLDQDSFKMSQVPYTELCDVDPMLDDITVVARCISIWHSHAKGRPNDPWSLDAVFMDPPGNRIQATIKRDSMTKFAGLLEEGACYRIRNFGVGENSGKFDTNHNGFKFEPFLRFSTRRWSEQEAVDIIGTIVSIGDPIPFGDNRCFLI
ncbi:phosphate transporter [Artemisia annua]|uniref:Phosphate transporter n=1 Tax=Artemisia annua TaxID=35608 RepID=A0A2U1M515_ARTAN|nr:phosphate transporter [Artemisia annua]